MSMRLLAGGVVALMVLALTGWARAEGDEERRDRQTFDKLRAELKQIDQQCSTAITKGVRETQDAGSATVETRSQIQMLVEKRDRLEDRISLVAMRWGFDSTQPMAPGEPATQPAQRITPTPLEITITQLNKDLISEAEMRTAADKRASELQVQLMQQIEAARLSDAKIREERDAAIARAERSERESKDARMGEIPELRQALSITMSQATRYRQERDRALSEVVFAKSEQGRLATTLANMAARAEAAEAAQLRMQARCQAMERQLDGQMTAPRQTAVGSVSPGSAWGQPMPSTLILRATWPASTAYYYYYYPGSTASVPRYVVPRAPLYESRISGTRYVTSPNSGQYRNGSR
jgi:hypothetical protein